MSQEFTISEWQERIAKGTPDWQDISRYLK